ncbi:MAG TPA: hypothetical protein VK699_13850 [Terriglobales bacterium]|jgi:hypothetical protein|nr:hypothetical protein [Terriglobales bacterium]
MSNLNQFRSKNPDPMAFVTLGGVPLRFELTWPFHGSTSGADFHVLHGKAWLLSDPEMARHAEFAANVSRTIAEAIPSLEPHDAEVVVINASRMAADAGRLEFKKSAKLVPVEVSSRHFSFKTNQIIFTAASEEQLRSFVQHKVYWLGYRSGKSNAKVWIADPYDCAYLNNSAENLIATAQTLAQEGLLHLEGEFTSATSKLEQKAQTFQADLEKTLESAVARFNAAMAEK